MNHRRVLIGMTLLIAVVAGAAREFLFINLNYEIDRVQHHRDVFYAHSLFRSWVHGFDLRGLLALKWAFALAFIGLMLALSVVLARTLFGGTRYRKAIIIGFLAIGLLAFGLHLLSGHLPPLEGISTKLLHLLQYPVFLFFLWASALLSARPVEP